MRLAHESARKNLRVTLKRSKDHLDQRKRVQRFAVGDPVFFANQAPKSKLDPRWAGPCLVTHVIGPDLFRILLNNRDSKVVHHDELKECRSTKVPAWLTRVGKESREESVRLYCLCKRPNDGFFMIQCDRCKEWFHGACVQVRQGQYGRDDPYFCPSVPKCAE